MFFYRDTIISARSGELLCAEEVCPLCGGRLTKDRFVPLRYSIFSLCQLLILVAIMIILLNVVLCYIEPIATFLHQFDFSTSYGISSVCLGLICIPFAFFVVWAELRHSYFKQYGVELHGFYCSTCGNGFVGVVGSVTEDDPSGAGNSHTDDTMITANVKYCIAK